MLLARIQELEEELKARPRAKEDDLELDSENSESEEDNATESNESKIASKSAPIKRLTAMLYQLFLGVVKMTDKSDFPEFEADVDNLPMVRNTTVRQVRFKWDQPWKDPHNHAMITKLSGFARSHGPDYMSNVKPFLDVISTADLEKRFVLKYTSLQKIWRGTNRGSKARTTSGGLSAAARDNRARGKLEVRIRKRANLPDGSEWKDEKYDVAFHIQLMSDDEDTKDPETGAIIPGSFTSKAPDYRSSLFTTLLDVVDDIPDNRVANQYTKRIRGEVKEQVPPLTRTLAGRARRWMVDADWLERHPEHDVEGRIADNGRLWGDSMDPEEIEEKMHKAKTDKKNGKNGKRKSTVPPKSKSRPKGKGKARSLTEIPEEINYNDIYED